VQIIDGTAKVEFQCQNIGTIDCPSGKLDTLITQIQGLDSICWIRAWEWRGI
jgi:hypothetical protein